MELRNLKRLLLVTKTLKKHNKKAGFEITQKRLSILTCIFFMQHYNIKTTQVNIRAELDKLSRHVNYMTLFVDLSILVDNNLLTKNNALYTLTIEARLLLQQLEEAARDERFDK